MRKSLNALGTPDQTLSTSERKTARRQCLVAIGKHIDQCLLTLPDPDKWHGYLWKFVSKFTEQDHQKLFSVYCRELKKMGEDYGSDKSRSLKKEKEGRTKSKDKSKEKSKEDVRSKMSLIDRNFSL